MEPEDASFRAFYFSGMYMLTRNCTLLALTALLASSSLAQQAKPVAPSNSGIRVVDNRVASQAGDTILWSGPQRLAWADYQGPLPEPLPGAAGTTFKLLANPEAKGTGGLSWYIHPTFSRNRSWATAAAKTNPVLLAHERLHFDLVEVYARKIRRYVLSCTGPATIEQGTMMNHRIAAFRSEMESENLRYDIETRHGVEPRAQAKWEADIAGMLEELKGYSWGACGLREH